ncbi:MAG TPA: tetratricopeptide repeat protein [Pyrinomonadaceae bacterium]|nr:tetratricopeptide repeat protein [Pyrinomonadaceae bacterium]
MPASYRDERRFSSSFSAFAPLRDDNFAQRRKARKGARRPLALALLFCFLISWPSPYTHAQRARTRPAPRTAQATTPTGARSLTVVTEPNAVVWLDELRRGVTNESGQLEIAKVSAGRHTLRVRARGFGERTLPLLAAQRGRVEVKLVRTTDEGELLFQQAEEAREKATNEEARKEAVELYRRALALRPRHAAARVGLARVLSDLGDHTAALEQVEEARAARRAYAEASAVEGRVHRAAGDDDAALSAYARAVREGRGFQPEAHTGTGLILQEKGDYAAAAASYRKAITQLADTEPVVYQLLGESLERAEDYKGAVAAYEKYLELAPEGRLAPAIRSVIDQLRKQAAEQDAPPE